MDSSKHLRKNIIWIFTFAFTLILFLTYNDHLENIFLFIATTALIFSSKGIIKNKSFQNTFIIFITVVITYVLSIIFLFIQTYDMDLKTEYTSNQKDSVAVMLVYQGESPMYDRQLETRNIILKKRVTDIMTIPFQLHDIKNHYKEIGKSNYKKDIEKIQFRLQHLLPKENKVYTSYLYDKKYVEERLIDIVNHGYHKIIIVPVFLTESRNLETLKRRIEKMKLFNLNIQIKYTEPLWDSENIVSCYLEKINNNVDKDNLLDTGIVLIGEGDRGYNNDKFIKSIKQNLMFRKKLKTALVDELGFEKDKIKIGWEDHIEPNYINEARSLLEYGVGEILSIYIKPQVTYIENDKIAEDLEGKVVLPEGVEIKLIDGFLSDTKLIYELRNKIQVEKLKDWN